MDTLRLTILQTDIAWEDKTANLQRLHRRLQQLQGHTDLVVLPEMFATGFSMHARELAEEGEGRTLAALKTWAAQYGIALCGSYIAAEGDRCFNRAFFVTPEGNCAFYDKRHLFRMGLENANYAPGTRRMVVEYRGWRICPLVCYDLRFPVWSRNTDNAYDLLAYVANWPAARRAAWDTLLAARAIENLCYVCGVNRVGTDGNCIRYNGGSVVHDARGTLLAAAADGAEEAQTVVLHLDELRQFREKFPAWKDADPFQLR